MSESEDWREAAKKQRTERGTNSEDREKSSSLGNSYRSVQAQSVMAVQADFPPVWVIIMKNKAKVWGFLIDPEQKLTLKAKNQVCLPELPTQQVCFTCPPCSRPQTRAQAGGAESPMGQGV